MNIFFRNRSVDLFKVTISFLLLYSTAAIISCAPENKGQRSDALAVSKGNTDETPAAAASSTDSTRKDIMKPGGNPPALPGGEVEPLQPPVPAQKEGSMFPAQPDAVVVSEPMPPPSPGVVVTPIPSPVPAAMSCKEKQTDVNQVRYVNAVNGLNLRAKPNTDPDSAVISFLLYSGKLTFHWGAAGWACVTDSVSKNIGYVSAEFLAIQKPE